MNNIARPIEPIKDSHCSFCGGKFTQRETWPRKCYLCWNESYKNPIPVVVVIVPVFQRGQASQCGWLIEQRGIEPELGGWALPSGYIDFGETWQQAAVRELQEEVGLTVKVEDLKLFEVVNSKNGNMLIFCTHKGVYSDEIMFAPNHEVSAIQFPILPEHAELCFPTHNEMWARYYAIEGLL